MGAAYVYERTGTTWTQLVQLAQANGSELDFFGSGVAVDESEGRVIVGASGWNDNGALEFAGGGAFAFQSITSAAVTDVSIILDGTLDAKNNPNEDADIGDKLAVFWPGDVRLNSTTGGVNFDGAIFMYGGDFSVGGDTVADIT